jgi:hypothetical protein
MTGVWSFSVTTDFPYDLNLDLIAASRTFLPLLIDEVERLRGLVRPLEERRMLH